MKLRIFALALGLALPGASAPSEQLPLKTYTTADGLPSDRIQSILADSHGFLWFGTGDGLARFDGYTFRSLGPSEGLPLGPIAALIETRSGTYWIATDAGLVRFAASLEPGRAGASARVIHLPAGAPIRDVTALLEDRSGVLWAATRGGLYRVAKDSPEPTIEAVSLDAAGLGSAPAIAALAEDRDGNLWLGTEFGLFRRSPDGAVARIANSDGSPTDVRCLIRDRSDSVWAGTHTEGLFVVRPDAHGVSTPRRAFTRSSGLAGDAVTQLLETADHRLWAACYGGVSEISADRATIRSYTTAQGLSGLGMWSLAEDRNGNLWIGSDDAGVMRLARGGFRHFDGRDGLTSVRVGALFENRDGLPCALTRGQRPEDIAGTDGFLECFDGERFQTQRPQFPAGTSYGWGWAQLPLRDAAGDWWVPTFEGLFRFPSIAFGRLGQTPALHAYKEEDGLPSRRIYRLYQDRRGDLWMGLAGTDRTLARWERRTGAVRSFAREDGIPNALPMAFAEDAAGAVWIGFFGGGLARHRDGKIVLFGEKDGLLLGSVRALHVDREGRLWIATSRQGLARVDRPAEDAPRFQSFGPAQGLSSGNTWSLAEDRSGRIYVGTERGLDRIDPSSGNVQHYTLDDGLARGVIETALTDALGNLWFGSVEGLSRLTPEAEPRTLPPPIRISRVAVNGVAEALPEIGSPAIRVPERPSEPASVEIRFVALDFAPGGRPRYQYRVDGIDREWSAPTAQPSVVYARLPSGRYRFRVRGIAAGGAVGSSEAAVEFGIRPSFWKRPEVAAAAALLLAAIAYGFHRNRLQSALAVERVRTRVATDLHDDVGAGLSEIAILSELAAQGSEAAATSPILREIGDGARRLVDSMGDIVWSTDPRKDDWASLVQRLRRFATNTLESRGIAWTLEVPPELEARSLDPERRRHVFLIAKEALTNIARHSGCSRASLRIVPGARDVCLEIEDDGVGFSPPETGAPSGHGLGNMRARALALRGDFRLETRPSGGTRLCLRVPAGRGAGDAA